MLMGSGPPDSIPLEAIEGCLQSAPSGVQACFAPVVSALRARPELASSPPVSPFAANMTDDQYLSRYRSLIGLDRIPPAVISPEVLGALNDPRTVDRGLALLRSASARPPARWKVMQYDSVFDNVIRIEVMIPGEDADRYVQLSVRNPNFVPPPGAPPDPPGQGNLEAVNIIVAQKTENGASLRPPQLHYIAPEIVSVPAGRSSRLGLEVNYARDPGTRSINRSVCVNCHQGSVLTFHPPAGAARAHPADTRTAGAFNDAINDYEITRDIGNELPAPRGISRYGPQLGQLGITRDDSFLASCASHTPRNRLALIRGAMNCAACHDSSGSKNPLYLGDPGRFAIVSQTVIARAAMPPGASLTPDERGDLFNCLVGESASLWSRALTPPSCAAVVVGESLPGVAGPLSAPTKPCPPGHGGPSP